MSVITELLNSEKIISKAIFIEVKNPILIIIPQMNIFIYTKFDFIVVV